MFFHSSSFTANPLSCAAANANVAIWREEPVLDRIADLARRQEQKLGKLAMHPRIRNARQIGTITAVEVEDTAGNYLSALGPRLLAGFRERDVLLRPLGNTVYLMPPYCTDDADLSRIYDVIEEVIA